MVLTQNATMTTNPKTEEDSVMKSAFTSTDFGFGHPLTPQQLDKVNKYRRNKDYLDKDAARYVHGDIKNHYLPSHHLFVLLTMVPI